MTFREGERVVFIATWSTWRGQKGRVVVDPGRPGTWVLIDGDACPVAVGEHEIAEDSDEVNLTGAE